MGVEHIGRNTSTDLHDRAALRAECASGPHDLNHWNARGIQLGGERRLGHSTLQEHDYANFVSSSFLACCQRVNDPLEAAEASRRDKVKNLQSPASLRRNPSIERPDGTFKRGIAYDEGGDRGIHPPSIRNAPRYPAFAAARWTVSLNRP